MASQSPKWYWDSNRQAHYYYDPSNNRFIYENDEGSRTPTQYNQSQQAYGQQPYPPGQQEYGLSPYSSGQQANPYSQLSTYETETDGLIQDLKKVQISHDTGESGGPTTSLYQPTYYTSGSDSVTTPSTIDTTPSATLTSPYLTLTRSYGYGETQNPNPDGDQRQESNSGGQLQPRTGSTSHARRSDYGPPTYNRQGGRPGRKRIRGTDGDQEQLDPRFIVRRPGRRFFTRGTVFKILWPEPRSAGADNLTISTQVAGYATDPRFGEPIYVKIRWFVVIREGRDCCSCLPMQTYGYQGVGKPYVIRSEHSIVFTGNTVPQPSPIELDPTGRDNLLQPIRLVPRSIREALDPWCRLNYGKIYTVEHNVKVFHWGKVHDSWMPLLMDQFQSIFLNIQNTTNQPYIHPINQAATGIQTEASEPSVYPISQATAGIKPTSQSQILEEDDDSEEDDDNTNHGTL